MKTSHRAPFIKTQAPSASGPLGLLISWFARPYVIQPSTTINRVMPSRSPTTLLLRKITGGGTALSGIRNRFVAWWTGTVTGAYASLQRCSGWRHGRSKAAAAGGDKAPAEGEATR